MAENPLSADLDMVLRRTRPIWEDLRGRRLFVTGGTGFFGCWLLETFAWANERCGLGAEMLVLTRKLDAFRAKAPHLAERKDIQFHQGSVENFTFPAGEFSHIIHAATDNTADEWGLYQSIVSGTQRALEFAGSCKAKKFLLTGSGAVYGTQPSDLTHVGEDYQGAPDVSKLTLASARGEGKRVAELLCARYGSRFGVETKIARCFAFIGPYMPLDSYLAIGNFIGDVLAGRPIQIKGDGTPFRSYLYMADLAAWLWTILIRGTSNRPYNVGSSHALTIAETAQTVARVLGGNTRVIIAQKPKPNQPAQHYVPNINRAAEELDLDQWTQLEDAIRATAAWHRQNRAG